MSPSEEQALAIPETERLRLRRLTLDDLDNLVTLNHDHGVMRYLDVRPPTRDETRTELGDLLREYEDHPGLGTWAAMEKATARFAGWFALRPSRDLPAEHARLGYRLRRAVWGLGYATEGSRVLVRYGFEELGLRRISADTRAGNERSRRVLEKAGLRLVRAHREEADEPAPGAGHGEVEYAVTREEWRGDPV